MKKATTAPATSPKPTTPPTTPPAIAPALLLVCEGWPEFWAVAVAGAGAGAELGIVPVGTVDDAMTSGVSTINCQIRRGSNV